MNYIGFELHQVSVDLFGGYCNCYILETAHCIYIIDTNIEKGRLYLEKALSALPCDLKPVRLLITHQHWDHVALAGWLKDHYNAEIWAAGSNTQMMADKEYQLRALYDRFALDFPFADSVATIYSSEFTYPCKPDRMFNGCMVFEDDDFTLNVLSTDGHCDGHFSFYNPQNRLLFCGDALQGRGYNRHPALYENAERLLKSLETIKQLKPKTLYGGHFIVAEPDSCSRYIEQSIVFVSELEEFCRKNSSLSFRELVELFCDTFHYDYSMHVVSSLNAHVHRY